ncbi:MAG: tetratricopeptide repeat protein [Cyanobacteriota bacterium]
MNSKLKTQKSKYSQNSTQNSGLKTQDCFWWVLLIGLPLVSLLLINLPPNLRFWRQSLTGEGVPVGLDPAYRYPFPQTLAGNVSPKLALQREIAFYQQRVSLDPQSGLNLASLAAAYLKMARATGEGSWYLLAEQTAKRSLASLPFDNKGAVIILARVAEARHDFQTALSLAKQVGTGAEDDLSLKVTANLAMGKVGEAAKAAEALVERIPNLGTLTLRALVFQAQGKDAEALQDFKQALAAEEPGEVGISAKTRTLLGRFYYQRGQLTQAEALYRETLRLIPRYPLALVQLAELETRQGKYQEAEHHYNQVIVDSKGAATVFDHVVDRGMARLRALQGDLSGSKQWQDKAEALLREQTGTGQGSGNFGHRRELALLLLEGGRPQDVAEALALVQEEVKIRRDARTLDTLAWALLRSGDRAGARAAIQEALHGGIRDAEIFYRAGEIEKALGNDAKAGVYFQQALATDPTFDEQARKRLGLGLNFSD